MILIHKASYGTSKLHNEGINVLAIIFSVLLRCLRDWNFLCALLHFLYHRETNPTSRD